ncbi:MAG: YggS family pyridoxal phosphate-dependent enzyme [Arachnia propionica]|nr:MAG: YggS family pyridoxal phosphate-dependent enzyme [Arachnia propionica]
MIGSTELLPVSKGQPAQVVAAMHAAGWQRFGENRAVELAAKHRECAPAPQWVFIGHLQSNKAKIVAELATEFQALDSLQLAAALDRRLQAQGRQLEVLVQVNSSGEPQKHGFAPEAVPSVAVELRAFDALRVTGLMTLAVRSESSERVSGCFRVMQQLQRQLQDLDGGGWQRLSMGMSGDYRLAIAHGATCVRIGQAIFGPRQ